MIILDSLSGNSYICFLRVVWQTHPFSGTIAFPRLFTSPAGLRRLSIGSSSRLFASARPGCSGGTFASRPGWRLWGLSHVSCGWAHLPPLPREELRGCAPSPSLAEPWRPHGSCPFALEQGIEVQDLVCGSISPPSC